jgi:hypothetical protein
MTPPVFQPDGISAAGIYALPSSMTIKIKGNSKIECNVDIQKEIFRSTKIEDSSNYRYIENTYILVKLQIYQKNTTIFRP